MTYATIDALRESLAQPVSPVRSPEYIAKMMHEVPKSQTVDRAQFILEHVKGKRVLEFGASGPMHEAVVKAAAKCVGVDREAGDGVMAFDLDEIQHYNLGEWQMTGLPQFNPLGIELPEVILCGEVVEHLTNPGYFLQRLKATYPGVPVLITVPNAFAAAGQRHIRNGVENVNLDHTCWFSYRTLKTLLERYGYEITSFFWYNGEPFTAEGLIVVAR